MTPGINPGVFYGFYQKCTIGPLITKSFIFTFTAAY